jgi:hypothetical protein
MMSTPVGLGVRYSLIYPRGSWVSRLLKPKAIPSIYASCYKYNNNGSRREGVWY